MSFSIIARAIWTAEGVAERHHLRKEEQRQRQQRESEQAKWARLSSEPLPPLPKLQPKQRDLVAPIVIGTLAGIACVATISWLYAPRHTQPTATEETTSSIAKPQSTVMEGLTPQQIELLKAKRDAMALPVAEPPHKKKWAE